MLSGNFLLSDRLTGMLIAHSCPTVLGTERSGSNDRQRVSLGPLHQAF